MFGLFIDGRFHVRGARASCWAAAETLGLTREVHTAGGRGLRTAIGVVITPCDAPVPLLAGDGLTLAGGAPLPPLPHPQMIDTRAA